MRKLLFGVVGGVAMLAIGAGTAAAQAPPLSTGPLCNLLAHDCGPVVAPVYDPPVTQWDDPRISIAPVDPGASNPIIDFGNITPFLSR